jgi:hypothetical protein
MEFNPVAILVVVLGILAVVVGIRGSNNAVFQTLTGHATTGQSTSATTTSADTKPAIAGDNTATALP